MNAIQIQNFKSIKESPIIELKPLNILIGRNSCGKSSFLRAFALLKQSLEKDVDEPILWYGKYVDFGSFKNTLNSSCDPKKDSIIFTFNLMIPLFSTQNGVDVTVAVKEKHIDFYRFKFDDNKILEIKSASHEKYRIFINETPIENIVFSTIQGDKSLFSLQKESEKEANHYGLTFYGVQSVILEYVIRRKKNSKNGFELLFDSEFRQEAIEYLNKSFRTKKDRYGESEFVADTVLYLLENVRDLFLKEFANVQYIQPIRASADRFYRVQGTSIKEVDSDGLNAPMILYYMPEEEKEQFEKWCFSFLGCTYSFESVGADDESTSIVLKGMDGTTRNMADVGFGFSQILPIILSIWKTKYKYEKKTKIKYPFTPTTIVIEQPELHLHPAFQQQVMSLILKILNSNENKRFVRFIIETHSEAMVNYLGRKIIQKEYSPEDLNLFFLNKKGNVTTFDKMIFDENGLIENWPTGFFSYED